MKHIGGLKVTAPGSREIVMTRVFDAPRRLVFDAITKPELLRRWFDGPPGWSLTVCEVDLKVGGAYRFIWRGPDGTDMGVRGVFREVVPAERTVQTEAFDQSWYPGEAVVTQVLVEEGGKTTLTLSVLYESQEARDAVLKTPMADGVAGGYDRLAKLLPVLDAGAVLTKDELISALKHEVDVLLHLASKIDPAKLDYRPTPKQRTLLQLLQYLAIMGPIHLRAVLADSFDMDVWRSAWTSGEAAAKTMSLEQAKEAIGNQSALFVELMGACSGDSLRERVEMFGASVSRGFMIVNLVLSHYAVYRMQLFLYLKASGREELSTMNLWVGTDSA